MQQFFIIAGSMIGGILILFGFNAWWGNHRVKKALKLAYSEHDIVQKPPFHSGALTSLPAPVQRYLRYVLPEGQRYIEFAEVEQSAKFRMNEHTDWIPVEADAYYATPKPAFIWDAVMHDKRFVWRTAQLVYLEETGSGLIKLFGGVTLADPSGDEADISLLFRFLSEAVWFPTVLLPGGYVQWQAIDDSSARASITDGDLTASAVFHFNAQNEVDKITGHDKFRDFKGDFHKEHFTMNCRNYQKHEGILIPTEVEFVWNLAGRDFPYAVFTVVDVEYTLSGETRRKE